MTAGSYYDNLDPFKVMAQRAAAETSSHIDRLGLEMVEWARGESVQLVRLGNRYIGSVNEGLGTKNLVADAVELANGGRESYYDKIAKDTVAMIVNDIITLGVLPVEIKMNLAVGNDAWMENRRRSQKLIDGWKKACKESGCTWGGGETPALRDMIYPDVAVLSGSAWGVTLGLTVFDPAEIANGDTIIIFESSGIHANGLTDARTVANKLLRKYNEPVGAITFGEHLLKPTNIYVPAVEKYLRENIKIHYAVNITGHGWRKLMRADGALTYIIDRLPTQLEIFRFLQDELRWTDLQMYEKFNMGAGFAIFVPEREAERALAIAAAEDWPYRVYRAGHIEAGPKRVVIDPKGIEFLGDTLAIR